MSQYTVEHTRYLTDDPRLDAIMVHGPVSATELCQMIETWEGEYGLELLDARLGEKFDASFFATSEQKCREIREKHGLEGDTGAQ